ncbi:MAG TPA: HigA family addiction module antitoxin [Bacteroidota bacterium]
MQRTMKPVHPGAILRENILRELKLTITKAAESLHVSRKQLSKIVNETAGISVEMALRLELGFGVEAQFWLDLQSKYGLWKIRSIKTLPQIQRIAS